MCVYIYIYIIYGSFKTIQTQRRLRVLIHLEYTISKPKINWSLSMRKIMTNYHVRLSHGGEATKERKKERFKTMGPKKTSRHSKRV